MSKKNKFNKGFVFENPTVISMDDLGYMQDDLIAERASKLEVERNQLLSMGKQTQLWEVEIAYVRREQQLRKTRAEMHAEYLKKFSVTAVQTDFDLNLNVSENKELN